MIEQTKSVDVHTHVFCWGENLADGYLSEKTRKAFVTRMVMRLSGLYREPGETISEKMRNRLIRQLNESRLDHAVILAQDAVYSEDGSRDDARTHLYVSNNYVLDLVQDCDKVIPGCSINPIRKDALQELERCRAAGCRLIKVHTAIQGVDPARADFDEFYKLARDLDVILMFHTGYEHSCTILSQEFTDPSRLARPLDHGGIVIAAHCGTCAFFDPEDYYSRFIDTMQRYDNLYGDTAIMASLIRWRSLKRLSREVDSIQERILHGSDYPFPPARLPYIFRTGLFPKERKNPFDMDLRIKSSFDYGSRYANQILDLLSSEKQTATLAPAPQ